jgi:hypothetical protein
VIARLILANSTLCGTTSLDSKKTFAGRTRGDRFTEVENELREIFEEAVTAGEEKVYETARLPRANAGEF